MEQVVMYVLIGVFGLLFLNYYTKYQKIKKSVDGLLKEFNDPIRHGYYKQECTQTDRISGKIVDYEVTVYVNELKRFTNGESKTKLVDIEISSTESNFNSSSSEKFIRSNFISTIETKDITWLEEEPDLKADRRDKLKKLKDSKNW